MLWEISVTKAKEEPNEVHDVWRGKKYISWGFSHRWVSIYFPWSMLVTDREGLLFQSFEGDIFILDMLRPFDVCKSNSPGERQNEIGDTKRCQLSALPEQYERMWFRVFIKDYWGNILPHTIVYFMKICGRVNEILSEPLWCKRLASRRGLKRTP